MQIIDLVPENQRAIQQIAALLVSAFAEHYPEAWPDLNSAVAEVQESFGADRLSLVAIDADEKVVGWIGGISQYDGKVWELHPVVVAPELQMKGIGRALVEALETRASERGALTMWLGTDDEDGQTSLSGVDIYDDLLGRLANISNLRNHPYEFYQRLGYTITGVMPDANGFGKPDIYMAKRIALPHGTDG